MLYKSVGFHREDTIGFITLNRPEAGNTIDRSMATEIAELCDTLDANKEIKVVIITGTGDKKFCAGTDPEVLAEVLQRKKEVILPCIASHIAGLKIPVIAAINGDASGQGLEMALACDLRIAVETAQFSLPQVAAGLIPWDGGTQRLPRLIGRAQALEMILTGRSTDAGEAYRMGLVSQVVPRGEIMIAAAALAKKIAAGAYWSSRYIKEAVVKGMDMTLDQGMRLESDLYFLLQTTEDRTEGIEAFQQKRAPKFRGK